VYELASAPPGTTYSTPVLWDSKEKTIVNNESTEILRMFNDAFGDLAANPAVDIFPDTMGLDKQLADLNDTVVYPSVNNGVYRCSHGRQSHFRAALLITPWIITIST
jgi:putative glutathione S-transferase